MKKEYRYLPYRTGVGIVVINNNNKVFVAKRIDNPQNFWQMPQGGVDPEEDFLDAAFRELKEETSITSVKLIKELDAEKDRFMICGSQGLNRDLIDHFESLNMSEGNTSIPGKFVVEKAFVQR